MGHNRRYFEILFTLFEIQSLNAFEPSAFAVIFQNGRWRTFAVSTDVTKKKQVRQFAASVAAVVLACSNRRNYFLALLFPGI